MLSRDQVLHVARLARLELTETEVESLGSELSKVLDHIEKIEELGDLTDVPPTSHVVDVENVLRADEPRPSLPREKALENAPDAAMGVGFPKVGGSTADVPPVNANLPQARIDYVSEMKNRRVASQTIGGRYSDSQP